MLPNVSIPTDRKVDRGEQVPGCPAHADPDGMWRIQDHATARALLRNTDTRQAGFGIENVRLLETRIRMPVLYRDGPEHREDRRQTARYFTPKRVDQMYRQFMRDLADEQLARLRRSGSADLAELSFALSVAVVGEVIGLTKDFRGMAVRLNRFFVGVDVKPTLRSPRGIWRTAYGRFANLTFYFRDVRPMIVERRRRRRDDLISHLIDQGCSNTEILIECLTFAAAGMVTTREFITVVAWHLFTNDALRKEYLNGESQDRVAILYEVLRLEPVVGNVYRNTTADIQVPGDDGPVVIPAGARVDIDLSAANRDPAAVSGDSDAVCPARTGAGIGDAGLSFGDGPHRCPGAYIALQETEIFISKLFEIEGLRMIRPPTARVRTDVASYEIVGLTVTVD